jgi:uncharacterized membrane protein HdeD (DUF308 family)
VKVNVIRGRQVAQRDIPITETKPNQTEKSQTVVGAVTCILLGIVVAFVAAMFSAIAFAIFGSSLVMVGTTLAILSLRE